LGIFEVELAFAEAGAAVAEGFAALAEVEVAGAAEGAKEGFDGLDVFAGDSHLEDALFEEVLGGAAERDVLSREVIEVGSEGGGVGFEGGIGGLVEGEALVVAVELPEADLETEAFRGREGNALFDLSAGHGVIPGAESLPLIGVEGGERADGFGFSHKRQVLMGCRLDSGSQNIFQE